MTNASRIPGFYRHSVADRLQLLRERGLLTDADLDVLASGRNVVDPEQADCLIENVIGTIGIPLGLGLNFLVNGKDYVVPMVVEEPSVVAAVSAAAKTIRAGGGFSCHSMDPELIGQIQVVDVDHTDSVAARIAAHRDEILDLANSLHPNMVARGGGARDVDVVVHAAKDDRPEMVVVHLSVDTRDAMGANLVNTMCEGISPLIEQITGGRVFLRILSNLTHRAMVHADCVIPVDALATKGHSGETVRDGIVLANQFAEVDPHRATTHNKGLMNGIDAVALATGNDWRAIEAAAHAHASLQGRYRALTHWEKTDDGHLAGSLSLPLKVGIVGGQMQSNPTNGIALRLLGVESAQELAEVMGAVGLAQNFGALRALSTEGIQRGHMSLHARSVAVAAGTPRPMLEDVVEKLIDGGEVKVWRASEILDELLVDPGGSMPDASNAGTGVGHGKIILLGEHAVVYGTHALAAPIGLAMHASVGPAEKGLELLIPQWNVSDRMDLTAEPRNSLEKALQMILRELGLADEPLTVHLRSTLPRAMGLGGSAALAVAVIRALDARFELGLSDLRVNDLAYQAEQFAHGRASGIDNSVSTYARPILFRKGNPPAIRRVRVGRAMPVVVGLSHSEGLTAGTVARVARLRKKSPRVVARIFEEIDALTLQGAEDVERGDLDGLGRAMNICHGLLNALQVSTHELEEMVEIARASGAAGAKLTGAGGGGAMIALAPDDPDKVAAALRSARYRAFVTELVSTQEEVSAA